MIHVLLLEEELEQKMRALDCIFKYDADAIVNCVNDGDNARRLLKINTYDIVLIHYDAPGVCECELWKYMRGAPVMLFTSSPDAAKEVFCFEKGAADYIARPYNQQAVIARGKRLLQRDIKEFGELKINYKNNEITLSGKEVLLTPIEKKFVFALSKCEDGMTFQELTREVWGYEEVDLNSMRVLVSKINKKLNGIIENVRNWGYRIKKFN